MTDRTTDTTANWLKSRERGVLHQTDSGTSELGITEIC